MGHIIRKVVLENLILTETGQRGIANNQVNKLVSMDGRLGNGRYCERTNLIRAKTVKLGRVKIAGVMNGHGT